MLISWLLRRRVLVCGALAAACLLLPAAAEAQEFQSCMSTRFENGEYGASGALSASGPGSAGVLNSPGSLVQSARICANEFANNVMVPSYGMPLFYSFALIIIVWTGLTMMFGAQFSMGEVVNLIFLLGVPYAILTYYATPAAFLGNLTFPDMVTGMGAAVAQRLMEGAMDSFFVLVRDVVLGMFSNLAITESFNDAKDAAQEAAGKADGGFFSTIGAGARGLLSAIGNPITTVIGPIIQVVVRLIMAAVAMILGGIILVLILIPAVITYCSFLWGQVSMLVAIVIGPLFVPFILIPQLSFLFWGWFKTLLGASVHMMIAGAVFAVSVQLLSIPLLRLEGIFAQLQSAQVWATHSLMTPLTLLEGFVVETVAIWLIAMLGAFKVGELTSMIMNSGPMPGSGLGDRLSQGKSLGKGAMAAKGMLAGGGAAGAAGGAAAAGATVATGGAAAAAVVASQATKAITK